MLTFEQKNLIGINFVFDKLKLSQSGRRRLKNMTPFTQAESKEWKEEIENVSRIVDSLNEYRGDWEKIACKIAAIKDLIPTFNKGAIRSFTEIELFEIKCFALNAMAIRAMFLPVAQKIGLSDTDIKSLQNIIDILDPLCNKSASFEIYSVYSDNLQEIRSNKLKLEKMLRECPDNMQFMAERTQLAADEKAEEEKILVMLTNEINMYINLLIETAFMIGKIDLLIAKAFLATEWDLARPELSDRIYFEDMINPYIADSLEQKGRHLRPLRLSSIKVRQ
jgi:Mismatch repair ATPase (MutS family)